MVAVVTFTRDGISLVWRDLKTKQGVIRRAATYKAPYRVELHSDQGQCVDTFSGGRITMNKQIVRALLQEARQLKSEHGENPEYDRALVELITFVSGGTADDFATTAKRLGITLQSKEK